LTRFLVIAVLIGLTTAHRATAGAVLDRVRRDGVVRCAAEQRPLVAAYRPDGGIGGIAVDLCRAVAIAVLGRGGRIEFTIDGPAEDADVAFVSDGIADGRFLSGPTIFVDRLSILVPRKSRVLDIRSLAGETVCLMIGSPEQSALEATVGRLSIDIVRLAFEEDDEMRDAYAVGRCGAMVGARTELSGLTGPMGINRLTSRVVPEALALLRVVVATRTTDGDWTTLVFRVVKEIETYGAGFRTRTRTSMPDGIRSGWLADAVAVLYPSANGLTDRNEPSTRHDRSRAHGN
jgi:general L-amino acid transport system substrate-binding protein